MKQNNREGVEPKNSIESKISIESLDSSNFKNLFDFYPGILFVLLPDDPKFTIVAVSQAFEKKINTKREYILGQGLFDILQGDRYAPDVAEMKSLIDSLRRVIHSRAPDAMGVQKYIISNPQGEGEDLSPDFEMHTWSPVNLPVFNSEGVFVNIIHRVEDVTAREMAELKQTQTEIRYARLFEASTSGIVIVDSKGLIESVNNQIVKTLGYTSEELRGRPIEILVPDHFKETHVKERNQYLANPTPRSMGVGRDLFARRKDGVEIPVEISLTPLGTGIDLTVAAIIQDITVRKQIELQESFIAESGRSIAGTMNYQERLQRIANVIVPKLADICLVSILEGKKLRYSAIADNNSSKKEFLEELISTFDSQPIEIDSMLENFHPILVEDIEAEALADIPDTLKMNQLMRRLNIKAFVTLPLMARGSLIGMVTLAMSNSGRRFSSKDIPFLEIVSSHLAVLVENAKLYSDSQRALKDREYVLSIVSHDLKNPLSAIKMAAQTLAKTYDAPIQAAQELLPVAKTILRSIEIMEKLTLDLLDFGKIQSGTLVVEKTSESVAQLMESVMDSMRPRALEKKIMLLIDLPSTDVRISCDKNRIIQVLWNLIGNAIKFTSENGEVRVIASKISDQVEFSIIDTGPGIRAEEIPNIFDRFWQANETTKLGTGLGLSIAKGIIESHGGKIWATSEVGHGSEFHFTIDAIVANEPTQSLFNAETSQVKSLSGLHVLLVDDAPEVLFMTSFVLKKAGARVTAAKSMSEALMLLKRVRPNVILSDIEMPNGDGYELIKRVHQLSAEDGGQTPAAAITGHSDQDSLKHIKEAGFQLQLQKPVDPAELIATVRELVDRDL